MMRKYDFSLLSRYRTELMGISMLYIMLFHATFDVSAHPILHAIKEHGNIGVDVFLILSAVGLYSSLSKEKVSVLNYYKRRVVRILPATVICMLPWFAYLYAGGRECDSIFRVMLDITSLSFWIDGQNRSWYVAFAIVSYLVYPAIFYFTSFCKDFVKKHILFLLLIITSIIINCLISISCPEWFDSVGVGLRRIPTFLIGCAVAQSVYEKKISRFPLLHIAVILSIAISIILAVFSQRLKPMAIWAYPYGVLAFSLTVIVSFLLQYIGEKNLLRRFFSFVGKYTLEIYLIHTQLITVMEDLFNKCIPIQGNNKTSFVLNVIAAIVSIILAVMLNALLQKVKLNQEKSGGIQKDYSVSAARFVAMCFIVACHIMQKSGLATDIKGAHIEWASWFNVGVQMFLFISGLLYGRKGKVNTTSFYSKGFGKIIVDYYIFVMVMIIVVAISKAQVINRSEILGLLTFSKTIPGLGHLWFVPVILLCYLLTPVLFEMICVLDRKSNLLFWLGSIFMLLITHLLKRIYGGSPNPVWVNCYILGMIYAKIEKRELFNKYVFAVIVVLLSLVILPFQFRMDYWPHDDIEGIMEWLYPYIADYGHVFLGIVLVIIIRKTYSTFVDPYVKKDHILLNWSDKYSYDIYLVHHVFVLSVFACVNYISTRYVALPLAIALSILCAVILHFVSDVIRNRIINRFICCKEKTLQLPKDR